MPQTLAIVFHLFVTFLFLGPAHAQDFSFSEDVTAGGYIKELGALSADNSFDDFRYDNIIHHRLETRVEFSSSLNMRVDYRTRLLNGYSVRHTPNLGDYYDEDSGFMDLSFVFAETDEALWHGSIDRLQATWYHKAFEVTAGRQRLNWGRTFVWSPNDLFNNFAYLNFDYEERPGTDAIRAVYDWSFASGAEIAYSPQDSWDESVLAGKIRTTIGSYDTQFIIGHYKNDLALGAGWSGYLGDAGLKGEITYFHPEEDFGGETGVTTATLGLDYMFSNGLYLRGEMLYNGGWKKSLAPAQSLQQPPSARDLFIAETGAFLDVSYQLHPLVNGSLSFLTSPTREIWVAMPQVTYSATERIDLLVLAQLLKGDVLENSNPTPNLFYTRIAYNF